jgi:hypothetical protein
LGGLFPQAPARVRFRAFGEALAPYVALRPYTHKLWLDVCFLLIIAALHHTVLPSFTRHLFVVDLMTPWIVATFVVATLPRAIFLGGIAALLLETHSAAPAGLYLCAFWVIAVVLHLTRSTLSWRHVFPWLVTLAASELWVMIFESFVSGVSEGSLRFDAVHLARQGLRLFTSTFAGLILARRIIRDEPWSKGVNA